jgi:hypothetical protein
MRGFTVQGVSVNRPSKKKVVIALNVLSGLTMGCRVCITALNRIRAESCLVLDLKPENLDIRHIVFGCGVSGVSKGERVS